MLAMPFLPNGLPCSLAPAPQRSLLRVVGSAFFSALRSRKGLFSLSALNVGDLKIQDINQIPDVFPFLLKEDDRNIIMKHPIEWIKTSSYLTDFLDLFFISRHGFSF